jgi:hypothetical protein
MNLVLARYDEIDPATRMLALAIVAAALALALGIFLWFSFRKR